MLYHQLAMSPSHQPLPQEDADDVERQTLEIKDAPVLTETAVEDTISARSKLTQLGFYFLCNVSLTIYNKLILGKVGSPRHASLSCPSPHPFTHSSRTLGSSLPFMLAPRPLAATRFACVAPSRAPASRCPTS